MKRLIGILVVFAFALGAVYAQDINKDQYREISIGDYQAAGETMVRNDTERFKLTLTFLLQAANSVAFQDADNTLHRFTSPNKLNFQRGQELILYVHSTHSLDGGWEDEVIDFAELKQ